MKNVELALALVFALSSAPLSAQTVVATNNTNTQIHAIKAPAGIITAAFTRTQPGGISPYTTMSSIVSVRSVDGGASWWLNTLPPPAERWESGPHLIPDGNGGCLLFYYGSSNVGISNFVSAYYRETSPDCVTFGNRIVPAGFPSRPPSGYLFVGDGSGVLTLAYTEAGNVYVTRSTDAGASWEAEHTPAAVGSATHFIYRAADQRYYVSYTTAAGLFVKSSGSGGARDWSTTPVQIIGGPANANAKLSVLGDGSLLLVWTSGTSAREVWAAKSADGAVWSAPFLAKSWAGMFAATPFALAGPTPEAFDLYWSAMPDDNSTTYTIYREMQQLPADSIFADTFEAATLTD